MAEVSYRAATSLEREFLRVVTRGFPELAEQIETCLVADYDPTGWCFVKVTSGPASPVVQYAEGPTLKDAAEDRPFIEILLWTDTSGKLEIVEVVDYGMPDFYPDPYQVFVDAANSGRLDYRFRNTHSSGSTSNS